MNYHNRMKVNTDGKILNNHFIRHRSSHCFHDYANIRAYFQENDSYLSNDCATKFTCIISNNCFYEWKEENNTCPDYETCVNGTCVCQPPRVKQNGRCELSKSCRAKYCNRILCRNL